MRLVVALIGQPKTLLQNKIYNKKHISTLRVMKKKI
jgi:hypothetical protein